MFHRAFILLSSLAFAIVGTLVCVRETPREEAPPTEFECRFTDQPITIDGKGDADAWKHAQVIDHFYLPWLGEKGGKARNASKAKLLWDREYLYYFVDMVDTDLYAEDREREGRPPDGDSLSLFLKPANDKPGYYEFHVNPSGYNVNLFYPQRGSGGFRRYRKDGPFQVETKVHLRGTLNKWQDKDEGWSVEGRIPWRDLLRTGGRPEVDERWRFAICRTDVSVDFEGPELSTCAPLTKPDFHRYEEYATLRFVGPSVKTAAKPYGIERRLPLTTSTVVGSPEPPPPYRIRKAFANLKVNFPIAVVRQPDCDRLLLITQEYPYGATAIRRLKDDPNATESEVLLQQDDTSYQIVFHPRFVENGYLYIGSNGPQAGKSEEKKTRVTRYTMDRSPPYALDPKSAVVIIDWPSDGHNGGAMTFGLDGMMYITSGDGTSDSDRNIVGQRLDLLTSKVLRIDVDHPEPGKMYSVPKDNPFVGTPGVRPEVWAYGLRNPWRITTDQQMGHIWVGNNGQDLWESAYLVKKGDNYGWSIMEGSHPFYLNRKQGPTPFVPPTIEHHHSEFRSLTGGIVYYGSRFPELQGAYLYGDYSTGKIWAMKNDGTKVLWHKELADTRLQITGFGTDSRGEILICDHRGKNEGCLYTLEATPKESGPSTFPRKLSESGLFASVKAHVMQPALIPYSVNAPLWSDGAHKERFIAMPGGDSRIEFTTNRGWNFPDKTVLVKSFALEMEEGNPASRRWIETRFLTNQKGEWFGYSYLWNDEQTDGTLVDKVGFDREFAIKTPRSEKFPDGIRKQTWHYPSRAECMVCHSRAANWVLGLTELQMNRVHQYGKVADNQLRTWEHLGLLRVNWMDETRGILREEAKAKGLSDKEADDWVSQATATRLQREPVESSLLTRPPDKYRRLADPYDAKADLAARARSYLHANCSQCHVEAGGGNALMELEFTTKLDKVNIINIKPQHHTFDLPDAKLVVPGHPERSVLLHRISHRKEGHMPPLATAVVDEAAVKVVEEWIRRMPADVK